MSPTTASVHIARSLPLAGSQAWVHSASFSRRGGAQEGTANLVPKVNDLAKWTKKLSLTRCPQSTSSSSSSAVFVPNSALCSEGVWTYVVIKGWRGLKGRSGERSAQVVNLGTVGGAEGQLEGPLDQVHVEEEVHDHWTSRGKQQCRVETAHVRVDRRRVKVLWRRRVHTARVVLGSCVRVKRAAGRHRGIP